MRTFKSFLLYSNLKAVYVCLFSLSISCSLYAQSTIVFTDTAFLDLGELETGLSIIPGPNSYFIGGFTRNSQQITSGRISNIDDDLNLNWTNGANDSTEIRNILHHPSKPYIYYFLSPRDVFGQEVTCYLYKTDYQNNVIWTRPFVSNEILSADINSQYIVCVNAGSNTKAHVFDLDGTPITSFQIHPSYFTTQQIKIRDNNDIYVSGTISSSNGNINVDGIVKQFSWTPSSATLEHEEIIIDQAAMYLDFDQQDNIYIGSENYTTSNGYSYLLTKMDANYNQIWTRNWYDNSASNNNHNLQGMKILSNGNIVLYGSIIRNSSSADCAVIAYNPNGDTEFKYKLNTSSTNENFSDMACTNNCQTMVFTGISISGSDIYTLVAKANVNWVTAIDDPTPQTPITFDLKQNYPNPFNPTTTIEFNLPETQHILLTVHNLLGQQVATLVNEQLPRGNHKVKFEGSSIPSGVYFYKIQGKSKSLIRKMIYIQ